MVESWDEVLQNLTAKIVQCLSAVHFTFEAEGEVVCHRTFKVRIPANTNRIQHTCEENLELEDK